MNSGLCHWPPPWLAANPSLIRLPEGCAFGPRCVHRFDRCAEVPPLTGKLGDGHLDACFLEPEQKKERRDRAIRPDLTAQQDLAVPQNLSPEPELTEGRAGGAGGEAQ